MDGAIEAQLAGSTLARYKLERHAGTRCGHELYEAVDERLGRRVMVRVAATPTDADRARFLAQARTQALADDPAVLPVFDAEATAAISFSAARWLAWDTLEERLTAGRPVTREEVVRIVDALAAVIDRLHERGMAHGALTAECVLVAPPGEARAGPVVIDFVGVDLAAPGVERDAAVRTDIEACAALVARLLEATGDRRSRGLASTLTAAVIASFATAQALAEALTQGLRPAPRLASGSLLKRVELGPVEPPPQPDPRMLEAIEPAAGGPVAVGDPDRVGDLVAPPAPEPVALDENVQFTVYRPKTIQPERWYPMLAFAHLTERRPDAPPDAPDPVAEVARQAQQVLGDQARAFGHVTTDSLAAIPRDGELTFIPTADGIRFNPASRAFRWAEDVHREEFRLQADLGTTGTTVRGRLSVFSGALIVADIGLAFRVDAAASPEPERPSPEPLHRYRRIFASYAHQDVAIAQQYERYAEAFGDRYLRDWVDLRSGQDFDEALLRMIDAADVFQLFWSTNSMRSPWVRREYEYAMGLGRPEFVRPTYWEDPLPQDGAANLPPPKLLRLHFQRIAVATPPAEPRKDATQVVAIDWASMALPPPAPVVPAQAPAPVVAAQAPRPAVLARDPVGGPAVAPDGTAVQCPRCGEWNPTDRVYCRRCAAELRSIAAAGPPTAAPARIRNTRAASIGPSPWLMIVVGLIALVAFATVAIGFLGAR